MRAAILVAVVLLLAGCELYTGTDADAPASDLAVEQCDALAVTMCTAASACGWDPWECVDHYTAACELNRTVVTDREMRSSMLYLSSYPCDDQGWARWQQAGGAIILATMLRWADEAGKDQP